MNLRVEVAPRQAIEFMVSAHIISETNVRGHWRVHHKRRAGHRDGARMLTRLALNKVPGLAPPLAVTLTRIRPSRGKVLDDDNLAAGFKSFRDGVALALGVDDGDKAAVTWKYDEAKGEQWAVLVRIEVKP